MRFVSSGRGPKNFYSGPSIPGVDNSLLVSMASHKSKILDDCLDCFNCFNYIIIDVIENTELKERKNHDDKLSKSKVEKLRKELRCLLEGGKWQHEHEVPTDVIAKWKKEILDWAWDDDKKPYVCSVPLLGEYIPKDKKVILYLKNIEDACKKDNVPYYCGVLSTYIHELFHAAHHEAAYNGGRQYETIREIEEAMMEFSTLVFLKEMSSDSSEWADTFNWAKRAIKEKQWCIGSLPAYGFGYYLFNHFSNDEAEAVNWIKQYNQKIGAIDKKNRYVKWYQQMLNPMYPYKDEKLCLELLHSILFHL